MIWLVVVACLLAGLFGFLMGAGWTMHQYERWWAEREKDR